MNLVIFAVIAGLPIFVLGMTVFNMLTWPRGRPDGSYAGDVSVLIPARNEENNIGRVLRSVFESDHPIQEVIVYDDGSTDDTADILERLQEEYPALRVLEGRVLPDGWIGKPHACHRLAERATGDLLFFVDADVRLSKTGLRRIASLLEDKDANVITAVPRQETGSFLERLVLPLLHLTYVAWFPLPLIWRSRDPRFLAANGQLLAIRRDTYEQIGGFEAVREDVVDDMAICRRAKKSGATVVFADGHDIATCRMYENARGVWEGFSKNLYEGIGAHPLALIAVLTIYSGAFLLPYAALAYAAVLPVLLMPALAGTGANVLARTLLAVRHGQPAEGIIFHPMAVLAFFAIALNSAGWHAKGTIRWSGRTYPPRHSRNQPSEPTRGA